MNEIERLVDTFGAAASDHGYARAMVRAGFKRPSEWLIAKGDNLHARIKARKALLAHVAGLEERGDMWEDQCRATEEHAGIYLTERDAALARAAQAEAEAERMRGIVGMLLDGVCPECGGVFVISNAPGRPACEIGALSCSAPACRHQVTADEIRSALAGEDGGRDV